MALGRKAFRGPTANRPLGPGFLRAAAYPVAYPLTDSCQHNSFEDPFYLTIMPDGKLVAGWGINTSWGTVTIRNGQATFQMEPPIAEGSIRLYLDGGKRTLIMDAVTPSFTAQVTPQR
jgi:hypothetical protein